MSTARRTIVLLVMVMGGCQAAPQPAPLPVDAREQLATVLSPRSEGFASPAENRFRLEVLLHAALYRAAYQTNVGGLNHFVLAPAQDDYPPDLGVDPEQYFHRRVLAELSDLGVPMAWAESDWREGQIDTFPGAPGTGTKATRLTIKITRRDENQATVLGEIGDRTAEAASSRQGVTAVWDGEKWNIQRDPVRVVW